MVLDKKTTAELDEKHGTLTFQGRWKTFGKPPAISIKDIASSTSVASAPAEPTPSFQSNSAKTFQIMNILQAQRISFLPSVCQQLHDIYMSAYLPTGKLALPETKELVNGNWMIQLRDEPLDLPALQWSLSAYSAAQIGRELGDDNLIQQSREMYLRGIAHLRDAIGNRKTMLSDQTLAACMAISIYDLTEGSAWKTYLAIGANVSCAYHTHINGAMTLVRARGPDGNTTRLGHSLFLATRRSIILDALMHHQDTFLVQPEWYQRPWSKYPKTRLDTCIDMLFKLPPLQRMWFTGEQEEDERLALEKLSTIIAQVTELNGKMKQWYTEWTESMPDPLYWPTVCGLKSKTDDALLGQVYPISFYFSAFGAAYLLITYWGGMMIIHKLLMLSYRKLASLPSCSKDDKTSCSELAITHHDAWMATVRNMCQTTEFFIAPEAGHIGSLLALTTLKGALEALEMDDLQSRTQREEAWIEEMMSLVAKKLRLAGTNALWETDGKT